MEEKNSETPLMNISKISIDLTKRISVFGMMQNNLKRRSVGNVSKISYCEEIRSEKNVQVCDGNERLTDQEVKAEALKALAKNSELPFNKVKAEVVDGWVTLYGELNWNYQREAARNSVLNLNGVKGVSNNTKIRSKTSSSQRSREIERALEYITKQRGY